MSLRRSDNVFLLTLVDFLVQIIFFGLLIFVVYKAIEGRKRENYSPYQVEKAIDLAGVSNIVELNDQLSKLAPVGLKGLSTKLNLDAKDADVGRLADAIERSGGAANVSASLERLAKLEQGLGKPPCLFDVVNGQKKPKPIAYAIASASTITLQTETPELTQVLAKIGLQFGSVRSLSLSQFKRAFSRLLIAEPACRHTLQFKETSRLVDARDAAGQIFYLQLRR